MSEIAATDYVQIFEESLNFDWTEKGDEFLYHMWDAMMRKVPLDGYSYQQHDPTEAEPYFFFGYKPHSKIFTSEIAFFPGENGTLVLVGITDRRQIPDQVRPWAEAIVEAIQGLDCKAQTFDWWAAIGPVGTQKRGARFVTNEIVIGNMRVQSAKSLYLDAVEGKVPNIRGYSLEASFPVVVQGVATGYDWSAAIEPHAVHLSVLCALLSVTLDVNWRVRQAPEPGIFRDPTLPSARLDLDDHTNRITSWHNEKVAIPAWCSDAWTRIVDDEVLATALHAYHTALALEEITPSYALLAYVGVIEGLGAKVEDLRRCDCCDQCTINIGAGRRFREALRVVLPEDEVKRLTKAYERRSKTAHEGRLHGGEMIYWSMPLSRIFAPQPASMDFRYRLVWEIRSASRKLLIHYLST